MHFIPPPPPFASRTFGQILIPSPQEAPGGCWPMLWGHYVTSVSPHGNLEKVHFGDNDRETWEGEELPKVTLLETDRQAEPQASPSQ